MNVNSFNNIRTGQIGPIKSLDHGVYTAEGIAPTGENMYFAIESLEKGDKTKWEMYRNSATNLVNGQSCDFTWGSLLELASRVNDISGLEEFLKTRTHPNYWTADKSKFDHLCAKLRERNLAGNSSKAEELLTIPHASSGINVDKQTHMVYVSKSPITGRINFTSTAQGFSAYVEKYNDLIMSVGVTISQIVENRGIFRNPLSVVEGGYGGISMMTHCFTCMVVEHHWPEIDTFKVRPLKKMGELFLNSLPKDQVMVNGIRGDMYDKGFKNEQNVQVLVKILANLHRAYEPEFWVRTLVN